MKRAIPKEQREEIIRLYLEQSPEAAQGLADKLLLEPLYARKLVRSRGLMPRTAIRWGQLREMGVPLLRQNQAAGDLS